jgi:hypothetical protein
MAALQYISTAILTLLAILPREPLPPVKNRTLGIRRSRSPMENAMLLAKRTPSGASCLDPRLKLQVSQVQGRLAVFLPSPVRSFGIQHANYTRTVLLPTHATAKYDQPQHPSRTHLSCRPVKVASCCCVAAMSGLLIGAKRPTLWGLFSLCLLSTICSCVAVLFANRSLRPFVRPFWPVTPYLTAIFTYPAREPHSLFLTSICNLP